MTFEKTFASLMVMMAANDAVIKDTKTKIVSCWEVIFVNSFEIVTRNPALVLSMENKAIKLNIANDADVKPASMRKVSCWSLRNEAAIVEDWAAVIAGRKPVAIEARNPRIVALANSFFSIFGNVVDCGGINGLLRMLNINMLVPNNPESRGSNG